MKTQTKKPAKRQQFWEHETPETNPVIKNFLSPLSIAVYKNHFKKFNFHLDGQALEVDRSMCMELYSAMHDHTHQQKTILQKAKIKLLKRNPAIKRFLMLPIEKHNLPTRLYHILKNNYCRHLADAAGGGERSLRRMRGMGNGQLSYLMKLFIDNGCGSLFI